jgi:RNA polymerase sigma-70 factor (ECF subfamily)
MNAEKRGSGQAPLPLSELEQCLTGKDDMPGEIDEITQMIDRFLVRLDPTQRRVFVQRYWYASSLENIAGDCGMTVSKAKSILFRLRKKLKNELMKEGVFL